MAHPAPGVPFLFSVWHCSKSNLDQIDPNGAFLGGRWHELFDRYTPDTFHPRLFGLGDLVDEAAEIARVCDDHNTWIKHLTHVRSEIRERIRGGFEKALCSPRNLTILTAVEKSESASEILKFTRILQLENFTENLQQAAKKRLAEFDLTTVTKRQTDIDDILSAIATDALKSGYAQNDFGDIRLQLQGGPETIRERILESTNPSRELFDIVVAVLTNDQYSEAEIRSVCNRNGVVRSSSKIPGLPSVENAIFLRKSIEAVRASDAVKILKSDLQKCLNILSLYKHRSPPLIFLTSWAIRGNRAYEVEGRVSSLRNLHPHRDASSLADQALTALGARNESTIVAALELHNIALSSSDEKLRLVNLWSAVECLASVIKSESVISRVEELITPILSWRKIEKVVRYIAINLRFWLEENPDVDRAELPIRLGYNDTVPAEQLLTLLTEPDESPNIKKLFEIVGSHELLRYRIYQARKMFVTSKELQKNLESSAGRLRWHLWRIYRARNLLVHQGVEPRCISQLADHLQQYFSSIMSRILHGLTFGEGWTAADSWAYWKMKSQHTFDYLKKGENVLVVQDVFSEPLLAGDFKIWNR